MVLKFIKCLPWFMSCRNFPYGSVMCSHSNTWSRASWLLCAGPSWGNSANLPTGADQGSQQSFQGLPRTDSLLWCPHYILIRLGMWIFHFSCGIHIWLREEQLPPPCFPLHMAASCGSRLGQRWNRAKTAHQRLAGKCALLLPGSGLNCMLSGLYEINHGKRIGGSCCGGQKLFSQLRPIQLELVIGRQVVDDKRKL